MKKTVVAIGEILWDVFPAGKKAGGSSMNVSLHLHKQDINAIFISAIGKDQAGNELLDFLNDQHFPIDQVQLSELPTSTVQVELDKNHQASYTIVEPVAWDDIKLTSDMVSLVATADAFVYCSLTCRNETSRNTINFLLLSAKLKVFDINLRAPFYTVETLEILLQAADILKVNEQELVYLKENFALTGTTEEQLLKQLALKFNIKIICLTLGENGAKVLHEDYLYQHQGYPANVVDTVGAGDSFLATFIASYLKGYSFDVILDRSCRVGAFVASKSGANPSYNFDNL
jgi:fructokinase